MNFQKANAISNSRMPSALKKRAPTKSKTPTQKNKKDVKKVAIVEPPTKQLNGKKHKELEDDEGESDEEDEDEEEDVDESGSEVEDDEGIDEAGLERLTNALGEDGESDGEEEESAEVENEVEAESGNESADEHEEAKEEEEQDQNAEENDGEDEDEDEDEDEGIALDDVESIDEDAVPRQKIEINNTVLSTTFRRKDAFLTKCPHRSHWSGYARQSNWILPCLGRKR